MDWGDLVGELDLWAEAGRVAELWWRDDDAVAPSPALGRLLDLAAASGIDVGLAVVPAGVAGSLAAELAGRPHIVVLQHGYRHRNWGPPGGPAVECGGARPVGQVLTELRAGYLRLERLFASRFAPVLAAPWNRIDPPVLVRLAEAGYRGASAFGPRALMAGAPGFVANVHIDPLNWREGGRFAGLGKAIGSLIGELRARRTGATEPGEPIGLLTHHQCHDAGSWDFLERLQRLTSAHPAVRWLAVREVFNLGRRPRAAATGSRP